MQEIKDAQKYAATVCQSDETYFLVDGSRCGILSAVFSATKQGGELLMARNCQKSVYDAAELRELHTHYLHPELLLEGIMGEVTVEQVEEALEKFPEVKVLIFASPTWSGVISDVKSIVKAAHAKGVSVMVDETYGAHFLKESGFPKSAIRCGADVVIQSINSALPAKEQTGMIHINKDYLYRENLRKYLAIFQADCPSEELLQSIDGAMHWYMEEGRDAYKKYLGNLKKLRTVLTTQLKNLKLLTPETVFDYDLSKMLISVKGCNVSGEELQKMLWKKYQIQVETVSTDNVLIMMNVQKSEKFYGGLLDALVKIDVSLEKKETSFGDKEAFGQRKILMRICEAVEKKKKLVSLPESLGEVSANYIYIDPSEIPLLVPGEKISERCVHRLQSCLDENRKIQGLSKEKEIEIVWEEYFT